jgi:endonuclease YncB( thermonuclease family)
MACKFTPKVSSLILCLAFLASMAASQTGGFELFLGDPDTKLFYSSRCDEAKRLTRRSEFFSPEAAEAKGFKQGECTITRPYQRAEELANAVINKHSGAPVEVYLDPDAQETFTAWSGECGGKVVGVHDGDTVTILNGRNEEVKVRLAGIDAPELGQGFGQASKAHLSSLVFGKQVRCESDKKDKYGRTVGKLFVDGSDVNQMMVSGCMAWHYKRYESEQSASDRVTYATAESSARDRGCGLWSAGNPMSPWEYRASDTIGYPDYAGAAPGRSTSGGGPKTVHVRSYTRKDGTRVRSHTRSAPRRRN